jgi:hypothetical protein
MIRLSKRHMEQALKMLQTTGQVHCGKRERKGHGTSWVFWLPKQANANDMTRLSRAERYVSNAVIADVLV